MFSALNDKQASYKTHRNVPYELLVQILKFTVDFSDKPLEQLNKLAAVCEPWRQIVLREKCLWSRVDLSSIPFTNNNIASLRKIFLKNEDLLNGIQSVSYVGELKLKQATNTAFLLETLISVSNLKQINLKRFSCPNNSSLFAKSILQANKLKCINALECPNMFASSQKWLTDFLVQSGRNLEHLNLNMSLNIISARLLKTLGETYCPRLSFLDLSTFDCLQTRTFDVISLASTMPNLEVLRLANVSFKRVKDALVPYKLPKLIELSMPCAARDVDRDDALFATLAYGSSQLKRLDLRGSTITFKAIFDLPTQNLTDLHIDDTCPTMRPSYHKVFERWAHSLENVSLVKINCSETINSCLEELYKKRGQQSKLRVLDLTGSDITDKTLKTLLTNCKSLESINLEQCRSLPRGCKGTYKRQSKPQVNSLMQLAKRLKTN